MKGLLIVLGAICWSAQLRAVDVSKTDEGAPFGSVNDSDVSKLMMFAKSKSEDLSADLELAEKKNENALSRVFQFSLKFTKFDDNARTYGQIIWSNFLALAEGYGPDWYGRIIASQPEAVRQRIRDIIYYPINLSPPAMRSQGDKDVRSMYPGLFPVDYVCGSGDPIFGGQANQSTDPTQTSGATPARQESRHP
jgi:hypothetical protein